MSSDPREEFERIEPPVPAGEAPLGEYWAVLVRRWKLIALCVAAALVAGAVYSLSARPTYRATVVLDVEREGGSSVEVGPTQPRGYDPEDLPTQRELIKSREVAERAVRRLNLTANPEFLAASKKSGFLRAGGKPASGSAARETALAAENVRNHADVVTVRGTKLLELSYVGSSAKLAADIANGLAEAYIEWSLESKFQPIGQTSEFLKTQTEQVRKELDAKEQELLTYGRQKDIVSTDPQASGTLQNLEALNRDFAAAVADRVAKEARYYQLRTARPDAVADTLSSGLISSLRGDQARLERDYAEKLNLYKPEWPAMLQMKAQIDKGRQNLEAVVQETVAKAREGARTDYLTALRREESLKGVLRSQKSEVMTTNTDAVEYNNLKAQVDAKRALLDGLLKKQSEAEVISRGNRDRASNVRIVDGALPPKSRYSPSYKKNGLIALAGGGLLGVGLAFLLSYLDRSLRTPKDVERHLQVPALGVIPTLVANAGRKRSHTYGPRLYRSKKAEPAVEEGSIELLPHRQPRSRIAERYRAFRTSLLLSRAGGVKSLILTSAFSREGKTATAVNLAVVLAQLGKRILLVDADLHRPRLHEIFRVSNRTGLVSILAENLDPERAVVETGVPDVLLVPSGPSSPNPSGLLSSEGMRNFLDLARINYDYVILDAPPVLPVADSIVIGHQTDGAVLCVWGGETPRDDLVLACAKLRRSGVRILGALINNLVEGADQYGKQYDYDDEYAGEPARAEEEGSAVVAARRSI